MQNWSHDSCTNLNWILKPLLKVILKINSIAELGFEANDETIKWNILKRLSKKNVAWNTNGFSLLKMVLI